jgi:hypothetical protein
VAELRRLGAKKVVAATRTPGKHREPAALGVEEREADFDRPEILQTAFQGVERLLLISTDSLHAPDVRIKQHRAAIQAAVSAGVEHIVYTSLPNAHPTAGPSIPDDHFWTEVALFESGLNWTIQAHVPGSKNDQVLGHDIEFERLDVSQWMCFRQSGDIFNGRVSPCADHDILAAQQPSCSIRHRRLNCFRSNKPPRGHDQFRTALLVESEVRIHKPLNHLAFPFSYGRHIHSKAVDTDPEPLTATNIVCELRRMNDVLAGQTCDVRA